MFVVYVGVNLPTIIVFTSNINSGMDLALIEIAPTNQLFKFTFLFTF